VRSNVTATRQTIRIAWNKEDRDIRKLLGWTRGTERDTDSNRIERFVPLLKLDGKFPRIGKPRQVLAIELLCSMTLGFETQRCGLLFVVSTAGAA
jgi:hypothetical protein